MNAKQKLHQAHLAEWTVRFSDQRASGLTVRQWCDQNHVSIHKYNYWKHQLKEEVVDQMLPDIVPLAVTTPLSVTEPALPQNTRLIMLFPIVQFVRIARIAQIVRMSSSASMVSRSKSSLPSTKTSFGS